ncbi:AVN_HP_G0120030.mRNA.1.CDS.1 [Saccharomyces cerevisiae]|nr:AVN_HP_G0120030.mRNA.1.CDS.1 [Saccharomyces cerevisiae]CAI6997124.1 AVN_HP_G0120030.mRNA.1.CDS.1 [Saccharomyces cerevisiae]
MLRLRLRQNILVAQAPSKNSKTGFEPSECLTACPHRGTTLGFALCNSVMCRLHYRLETTDTFDSNQINKKFEGKRFFEICKADKLQAMSIHEIKI